MKKRFLFFLLLFVLSCDNNQPENLRIATAANMQFAMEDLTKAFTAESGIKCETIISSSGKLTAQITQGAPYDIFISADMKYPTELYNKNLTIEKPKVYAYGSLVLWTMKENISLSDFENAIPLLNSDEIQHIALANPKTAPYGVAALQVLKHNNLLVKIEDKLVYGESIAQTNQFVTTQAAELGFTAKSVVLSPRVKNQGQWISIDPEIYTPISQGVVLLKNSENRRNKAQKFYNFLFSAKAKEILNNFGYLVSEK